MADWTIDDVANRFADAAETSRRLPRVRVQGYFSAWPAFAHDAWDSYPDDEHLHRHVPPSPQAIERVLEVMRWVQWLEVEQRHLVWMRAKQYEWRDICRRIGCDRTTAWRRWKKALQLLADRLNLVGGHEKVI